MADRKFQSKEEFEAYLANPNADAQTNRSTLSLYNGWFPKVMGFAVIALVLFLFYPRWGEPSTGQKLLHGALKFCGYDSDAWKKNLSVPKVDRSGYANFRSGS